MKLSGLFVGIDVSETNIESFDIEIEGIKTDSRMTGEGDIFVCLNGTKRNGHGYIKEALGNRAAVIVIEDKSYSGDFPYIRVSSTRKALAFLWNNLCCDPCKDMKLIGITGTNGKSSVAAMIGRILESAGKKSAVIGTLNASLTTPDPWELYPRLKELKDKGYEYVVMEASSHALELEKLSPLKYEIGIFTNLTRDHLDFHKSMYAYAKAKGKLFESSRISLYNIDDIYSSTVVQNKNKYSYSYSLYREDADYIAKRIKRSFEKQEFDLLSTGEIFHIESPLIGEYNVSNALAAASCCRLLGIDGISIKKALKSFCGIKGRMERVDIKSGEFYAFIDYAHTPDALMNTLLALKEIKPEGSRLVCVFGCGGDRDKGKRAQMGEIASRIADFSIITSDNPRTEEPYSIIKDIVIGIKNDARYLVIADRRQAIRYAVHSAEKGDLLVFLGKGHETYEIIGNTKSEFNESSIIQEADKERIEIKGNEYYSC